MEKNLFINLKSQSFDDLEYEDLLELVHHSEFFVKEERRSLFAGRAEKIIKQITQSNGLFAQFYQPEIKERKCALIDLIKKELYPCLVFHTDASQIIDLPNFQSLKFLLEKALSKLSKLQTLQYIALLEHTRARKNPEEQRKLRVSYSSFYCAVNWIISDSFGLSMTAEVFSQRADNNTMESLSKAKYRLLDASRINDVKLKSVIFDFVCDIADSDLAPFIKYAEKIDTIKAFKSIEAQN